MRSLNILLLMLFVSISAFGQISFEKGYYVNNDNQKIECLIENKDWKNNPKEFDFVLNENDAPQKGDLTTVKEFGIYDYSRYVRASVQIDRSSQELTKLSREKSPVWSQEQLFLRVLQEGKASLYQYVETNYELFFYSKSDTAIQQLIYKEYMIEDGTIGTNKLGTNNAYKQQLWLDVRCTNIEQMAIENLVYQRTNLEKYFIKYNECNGNDANVVYDKKKDRQYFNLSVVPAINFGTFEVTDYYFDKTYNYDYQLTYRFGIEAEIYLPFNKNKWSFVFEPNYQYFEGEEGITSVHYEAIEIPLGIRHYFYLKPDLKLFIDGFFIPKNGLYFNTEVIYQGMIMDEPMESFAFGGGVSYKRFNLGVRYCPKKEVLSRNTNISSEYSSIALLFSYRIFQQ